jgi:XTP/dITP diphosphohydrolase
MTAGFRRFDGRQLILASHNAGKLTEMAALLAPFDVAVQSAADLGLPEPEETGATFLDNAVLKAVAAVRATDLPALADDSGLAVDRLDGQPGLHSARWAGPERDFAAAMRLVWDRLDAVGAAAADRTAHFVSVIVLAWPDGHQESFEGRVDGVLVWPPRGSGGFGYDPMFQPAGFQRTFGEMSAAEKKALSHRAIALGKLTDACFQS